MCRFQFFFFFSRQPSAQITKNQRSWEFYFSFISLQLKSLLQAFILRARVLKLYRQSLRVARRAPGHSKDELRNEIRQEVEKNRDCNDKQRIRFLISEGLEKLKSLDEMLDMQGH